MHKKSSKNGLVSWLEWRSKVYFDSQDVNNAFNEHFAKVVELLTASCDVMSSVKKRIANSIFVAETNMYEIIQLINNND